MTSRENDLLVTFCTSGSDTSLLRSRFKARHATLLPTNGCFLSNHIPFPLFVGTGDWPIISQSLFAIERIKLQQKDFPANLRIWDFDQRKSVFETYHRFRWHATLENRTPAETFPKFPSVSGSGRTLFRPSKILDKICLCQILNSIC